MDLIIELFLFAVKGLFKNEKKALVLQEQLLEIRDDINLLYPGK